MKTCPIDSKKNTKRLHGKLPRQDSYDFQLHCRNKMEVKRLRDAGYWERPEHEAQYRRLGWDEFRKISYSCAGCEYVQRKESSPTGFYCSKLKASDAAWGCCSKFDLAPDLRTAYP